MELRLPTKSEAIIGIVLLAVGGALGYEFAPHKVEVREKIVTQKSSDTERTRDKDVVRVKEIRPDGTEVIRTELHTRQSDSNKTTESTTKESEKIVTRDLGVGIRFMAKGAVNDPTYGVGIDKKFLGPITLGVVGFTDKTFGISIGVQL